MKFEIPDIHDSMIAVGLILVFTGVWQLTSVWHAMVVVGGLIFLLAFYILTKE